MLVAKGLVRGLFQLALFATFLLVPAAFVPGGTWYWPRALVFLGVYGVILAASTVALAVMAPASPAPARNQSIRVRIRLL